MTEARRLDGDAPAPTREKPRRALGALKPVSARPPFRVYVRQVWDRRHFIAAQAWARATTQHHGLLLGNLWLVLLPLMDAGIYLIIFGVLFRPGMPNFESYLIIGLTMFTFTTRVATTANTAIATNMSLIRGFMFPRAVLPLSALLRETVLSLPLMAVMFLIVPLTPQGHLPRAAALLVPALFAIHFVFNAGLGLLVARIGAAFPDSRHLVNYAFRFLMYGSAVMFAVERYDALPLIGETVRHNPLFLFIDGYRSMIMRNQVPTPDQWLTLTAWAIGLLIVGAIAFWHGEETYGRER